MTPSGILMAREVDPRTRAGTEKEGASWRHARRPTRAPRDDYEDRKFTEGDKHKVYIKGRYLPDGSKVYDVLRILGPGQLQVFSSGCRFFEEAVALSMDAMLGRISVSMSGRSRTVLEKRKALISPNRGIWLPGGTSLDVRPTADPDVTVVLPRFATQPARPTRADLAKG